ncbi:unnamed protein product [marine sediment metagenome]|uniref:Uncharacterized protein n=1 Tax=marine sediment metagenome TaxID=412755 RepID=X1AQD4_9ZZZZ
MFVKKNYALLQFQITFSQLVIFGDVLLVFSLVICGEIISEICCEEKSEICCDVLSEITGEVAEITTLLRGRFLCTLQFRI